MARPLRIEYEGAHYHVTSRENECKAVFRDDTDRAKFPELTGRAVEQFNQRVANNSTRTMAQPVKAARAQIQESRVPADPA